MSDSHLIEALNLRAGYSGRQVLNGVDIRVTRGEIIGLIGHNGAGKSTILRVIFGIIPWWSGNILWLGNRIAGHSVIQALENGISYVPQSNGVFSDLSVTENLEIGGISLLRKPEISARTSLCLNLFPALRRKARERAGNLSGGERQMLALARGLVPNPRLLLLDEPSLGLSPDIVPGFFDQLKYFSSSLGLSMLIAEQRVKEVLRVANRVYVVRGGIISFAGPPASLQDEAELRRVFL